MYERFISKIQGFERNAKLPRGLDVNDFCEVRRLHAGMVMGSAYVSTRNASVARFFRKWGFFVKEESGAFFIAPYGRGM